MQQGMMALKIILPVAAVLAFCLLPRLFRDGFCFGVALAKKQQESKPIKNIILLYEVSTASCGGILLLINLFFQFRLDTALSDLVFILALFGILAFVATFYAMAAKAVSKYKERTGHEEALAQPKEYSQNAGPIPLTFTEGRLCPSLWWYLLHAGLIAACVLLLYVTYPSITPYVALWTDFSGNAVWTVQKLPQTMALPVLAQTGITLLCFAVSWKIKSAPLSLKGVNAQAELDKSRKTRAIWSAYVCVLAFIVDLTFYAYLHFMFLTPQYKACVPIIFYAELLVLLAVTLFLAYHTREK